MTKSVFTEKNAQILFFPLHFSEKRVKYCINRESQEQYALRIM